MFGIFSFPPGTANCLAQMTKEELEVFVCRTVTTKESTTKPTTTTNKREREKQK